MSSDAPLVSVVVAAYNGARFLPETIASLSAQTMPDFEIVVVDDCSTDDTLAVLAAIAEPRLRVIRAETNGGPAVARTLALAHARGRFIAGLDQDDLCRPERFARQIAYLGAHPDTVLVASAAEPFGTGIVARSGPAPALSPEMIDWRMTILNPLAWSSVLMRGDAARALDPFERDAVRCAEDFDLYHRIRAHGRIARIDEPLVRYRHHAGGLSKGSEERMIASAAAVLAARYGDALGIDAARAGQLMSRHAAARHPIPNADTLFEVSIVLKRVLLAFGDLAPADAAADAEALWWRMARSGLRAGCYGVTDMVRASRAFATGAHASAGLGLLPDIAFGAGRRLLRRQG